MQKKTRFCWLPRIVWRDQGTREPAGVVWLKKAVLAKSEWVGWIAYEHDQPAKQALLRGGRAPRRT